MRSFSNVSFPAISVGILDTLGKNLTSTLVETLEPVAEQIQIQASVNYNHHHNLLTGELDIVITAYAFESSQFDVYPIVSEPLVILVPKGVVHRPDPG